MQVLEPPHVFYYETPSDPTLQDLKVRMVADGANLEGNVLGLLVKTPPDEFFGVPRYELEIYFGEAYNALTSSQYRNRDGVDWLIRGAQDNPQTVVDNLQTSIAEAQAGRDPFAWQTQQLNQASLPMILGGVVLLAAFLLAMLGYRRKRVHNNTSEEEPRRTPSYQDVARERLEQALLYARYGTELKGYMPMQAPEAIYARTLLFGDPVDAHSYDEASAAIAPEDIPQRDSASVLDTEHVTPFDDKIRSAFNKLDRVMRAKQLEMERCYYNINKIDEVQRKIERLRPELESAAEMLTSENARELLGGQLKRLSELESTQIERKHTYETIAERLYKDMQNLLGFEEDLLKKRQVYFLIEASLDLQRGSGQGDDVIRPSGDIQDVVNDVDDLIEAYMEVPLPSYNVPSYTEPQLPDVEKLLS